LDQPENNIYQSSVPFYFSTHIQPDFVLKFVGKGTLCARSSQQAGGRRRSCSNTLQLLRIFFPGPTLRCSLTANSRRLLRWHKETARAWAAAWSLPKPPQRTRHVFRAGAMNGHLASAIARHRAKAETYCPAIIQHR